MSDKTISGNSSSVNSYGQWQLQNYSSGNSVLIEPTAKPKTKPQTPFPHGNKVSVNAKAGEDPIEVHRRILLEAASQAGLDGTDEQKRFVEQFIGGLKYTEKTVDPSPQNDKSVKSSDIKNEPFDYELSPQEIAALRQFQKDYRARGGTLRAGKVYDYSTEGRTLTAGEQRNGKRGITNEQYERWKMRDLMQKAQILPSTFGTPSKLRDLKHIAGVKMPNIAEMTREDRALLGYIEKTYGGGNLWGDKLKEILDLSKQRGVRIENLMATDDTAEFDVSVENLLKLHHTYIGVQEQFNAAEKIANTARDKMALNQFLIGAGEGAWGAVKANYKMVAHPLQTINEIKEAVTSLANLTQDDLLKIYDVLKAEGKAYLFEKDVSEVSRDMGKVVGAALVELALGKGIGAGLKALRGIPAATAFLQKANELKQTIGKLPVPTPAMKVVVDTMGNKMIFPDVELTKLEDLIKPLESRAQQILSGAKKAVNLPAWEKLSFKLDPDGSIHFLSGHRKGGTRLLNSIEGGGNKDVFPEWMTDKQVMNAVKDAYKNSKKIKTQTLFGEEKVKLIGESNGLRIEMWVNLTTKTLETAYPVR